MDIEKLRAFSEGLRRPGTAKNHHYYPRLLLKRFSAQEGLVLEYDRESKRCAPRSVKKQVACEMHLFTDPTEKYGLWAEHYWGEQEDLFEKVWGPYRGSGYKAPAPRSRDIAWFLSGLLSRNKISQEIAKWATAKAAEAAVAEGSPPKSEEELKAGFIKVLVAGGIQAYTPVILRGKWKLNKRPAGEARMLVSDMGAVLLGSGAFCFPFSPDEVFVVDASAANFKPLPHDKRFKDPILTVTEAAPQFWRRIRDATVQSAQSKLWGYAEEDFPT